MSVRIGNPQQTNFAATVLGGSDGISIPINNSGWALLLSVLVTYTATNTAGNRQVVIDITDPLDNVIWRAKGTAFVTAGQVVTFALGGRVQDSIELRVLQQVVASGLNVLDELDALRSDIDANSPPLMQVLSLPEGFSIPVSAAVEVLDFNGVDNNDTVSATIVFTL
jgi:hypothetical protein